MRNILCAFTSVVLLIAVTVAQATQEKDVTLLKQGKNLGLSANLIWFDATANLERLSSREKVQKILDKCADAGINGVAVGVKSSCGFVLYNSKIAPRMGNFMGRYDYPKDYDLLQTVIEEAKKRHIRVYAMLMVFAEGRLSNKTGPAYSNFKKQQSWLYDIDKNGKPSVFPAEESPTGVFVFVNPALPEVQKYELSIIEEIARNYDIDGIIIDRCRYDGIRADFSEESKKLFENYIGDKVCWPEDVYTLRRATSNYVPDPNLPVPEGWMIVPGPYLQKWVEWRAKNITDFVLKASDLVKSIKPKASFGSVVGAWYPEYVPEGVNWASRDYVPKEIHWWATPAYRKTGYAEYLDFIVPNCYGELLPKEDAGKQGLPPWWTIEGGAMTALDVTNNVCHVYAGIYALHFKDRPEAFKKALQICIKRTGGVKLFDLSQIDEYNWWGIIKQVLKRRPAGMPHEEIKSKRSVRDGSTRSDQKHK